LDIGSTFPDEAHKNNKRVIKDIHFIRHKYRNVRDWCGQLFMVITAITVHNLISTTVFFDVFENQPQITIKIKTFPSFN